MRASSTEAALAWRWTKLISSWARPTAVDDVYGVSGSTSKSANPMIPPDLQPTYWEGSSARIQRATPGFLR